MVVRRDVIFNEQEFGITDVSCIPAASPRADNPATVTVNISSADEMYLRRSDRPRRSPQRLGIDTACHVSEIVEPLNLSEVEKCDQRDEWLAAAENEY